MMNVICKKNKGYKWTITEQVYFRGYIQLPDGKVLRGEEAIRYFDAITSFKELENRIRSLEGFFCVVIRHGELVWAGTDIYRSMPLYYSVDGKFLSDSSECIRQMGGYCTINDMQLLEMYSTNMIAFEKTMYDEISQIPLGCIAEFRNSDVNVRPYYNHYVDTVTITREKALGELEKRTDRMISKLRRIVENREIAISLSSGFDSRYLACSLKKNHLENVTCFTYGVKDSFEIEIARKIATTLGYRFIFIEQTTEKVKRILNDKELFEYCNEHDYGIYLQNYVAIRELSEKKLISEDAVIMTGLWNDAPSGFYVPSDGEIEKYGTTNHGVAQFIADERFSLKRLKTKAYKSFVADVEKVIQKRELEVHDKDDFVHVANCIMIENEHSRFYMHMNTIHEFFGHEYLFPALDKELLDLWYCLPREMLYQRNLYAEYITQRIGKEFGLTFGRETNVTSKNPFVAKIKRNIGGILVKVLYTHGIPFKRNTDINGFSHLEADVCWRITQKNAIVSEHANLGHLMNLYLMEKRYGTDWWKKIRNYLV